MMMDLDLNNGLLRLKSSSSECSKSRVNVANLNLETFSRAQKKKAMKQYAIRIYLHNA